MLLPIFAFGAYQLGMILSAAPKGTPDSSPEIPVLALNHLTIDPSELQLGEVWEDPKFSTEVNLTNLSDQPVSISKFSTSCTCSGVEPSSLVIPPKGVARAQVKMDLTHRLPHQLGMERRPLSVVIHPVFDDIGASAGGWEFTGVVRSRVSLNTSRLDFTDLCLHNGPAVSRKVRATAHAPIAALTAVAVPPSARTDIEPTPGKPGQYEIFVAPNPNLPVGPFQFEIDVSAMMLDGVRYRCASISVRGDMQPSTRIVPALVLLGEPAVGKTAEAEVTLRLPGQGSAVDLVLADSPDTTVQPKGASEDGALRYQITQRIATKGDQKTGVTFVVRKVDGSREQIKIEVRYHGIAADKIKE